MSGQMTPGTVLIFFNKDEILGEGTDCCSCHASNHLVAKTFFPVETQVVPIVIVYRAEARLRCARCRQRGEEINNQLSGPS